MIHFKNLNVTQSIDQQKLIYDEDWFSKLDRIFVYLLFSWGFIIPFLVYFDPHRRNGLNTGFENSILFFFGLFCAYNIYRKATEKKLKKICSEFSQEENAKLINDYCKKLGYEKYKNSKNIIIYNKEPFMNINSNYKSSRIFLLKDNAIYFTMIKDNFKLNIPVLFSQIELCIDLKKMMSKKVDSN